MKLKKHSKISPNSHQGEGGEEKKKGEERMEKKMSMP